MNIKNIFIVLNIFLFIFVGCFSEKSNIETNNVEKDVITKLNILIKSKNNKNIQKKQAFLSEGIYIPVKSRDFQYDFYSFEKISSLIELGQTPILIDSLKENGNLSYIILDYNGYRAIYWDDFNILADFNGEKSKDGLHLQELNLDTKLNEIKYNIYDVTKYGAIANDEKDDRQAFEEAYNYCESGDYVYIPKGIWDLKSTWSTDNTSQIKLTKDNVNIRGQSKIETIIKTYLDDGGTKNYSGIKIMGVCGAEISNFTITNIWNKAYSLDTVINNTNAGGLTNAISISSSKDKWCEKITISNIIVEKFRRAGFRIAAGSRDIWVNNCIAKNATDVAGGGAGYGYVLQGETHTLYSSIENPFLGTTKDNYNNALDNVKTEGPYIRHGVIIQYWAHNNIVKNSTFSACRLDAIDLHGEDEYENEICYNTIIDGDRAGIALGNSGAGHDKSGKNNWIHHNEINNCLWGITVEYGTDFTIIENNTIKNNKTKTYGGKPYQCAFGIGGSNGGIIRNNKIQDNSVKNYKLVHFYDNSAQTDSNYWESGECPAQGPKNWIINNNVAINSGTNIEDTSELDSGNVVQTIW